MKKSDQVSGLLRPVHLLL